MLRKAAEFYSVRKIEPTKSELKEISELKRDVPILSSKLSKLEKMVVDCKNQEIIDEYNCIKLKHNVMLERLGELTKKRESDPNTEKLAIISKTFKILGDFYKYEKQATMLHSLINKKLNAVTDSEKSYDDSDDDEPVFLPKTNNKFNLLGKQESKQSVSQNISSNISTPNIEELIKKYNSGSYLITSHKKLVEEELAKREQNKKNSVNDFPSLSKSTNNFASKTYSQSYANIISNSVNNPIVKEEIVEQKAPINTRSKTVGILKSFSPEYKLIRKEDLGYMIRATYEYIDENNKIRYETILSPSQKFHNAIHKQNLYLKYISEKEYKPWIRGMTFNDWLQWQDEIAEMEERDRYEELDLDYDSDDSIDENTEDDESFYEENEFEGKFSKKNKFDIDVY